jgi:flagellar assembly protein FliH
LSNPFFHYSRDKAANIKKFDAFQRHVFAPPGPKTPQGVDYDFDALSGTLLKKDERFPVYPLVEDPHVSTEFLLNGNPSQEEAASQRSSAHLQARNQETREAAEALLAEAQKMLESARAESGALLERAHHEVAVIEQQAYQAGFAQGEEAGKTLGEQKIQSVVKNLVAVLENAGREVEALLKANETDVTRAAVELTLQLMHREIQQDPSVVLDMARAALRRVRDCSHLTFQVSSSDAAFLEGHLDEFHNLAGSHVDIQVEVHPDIGRGGCRLLCDSGMVDATIETMVRSFLSQIMEE